MEVGCHALLQMIFLTQGLNSCLLCLPHCRQILYSLSHCRSLQPNIRWLNIYCPPCTLSYHEMASSYSGPVGAAELKDPDGGWQSKGLSIRVIQERIHRKQESLVEKARLHWVSVPAGFLTGCIVLCNLFTIPGPLRSSYIISGFWNPYLKVGPFQVRRT